jgi:hypothetical protein
MKLYMVYDFTTYSEKRRELEKLNPNIQKVDPSTVVYDFNKFFYTLINDLDIVFHKPGDILIKQNDMIWDEDEFD